MRERLPSKELNAVDPSTDGTSMNEIAAGERK
jgi:hypothetical protein